MVLPVINMTTPPPRKGELAVKGNFVLLANCFWKTADGMVSGFVNCTREKNNSMPAHTKYLVGQLPEGFRPEVTVYGTGIAVYESVYVDLEPDGNLYIYTEKQVDSTRDVYINLPVYKAK